MPDIKADVGTSVDASVLGVVREGGYEAAKAAVEAAILGADEAVAQITARCS